MLLRSHEQHLATSVICLVKLPLKVFVFVVAGSVVLAVVVMLVNVASIAEGDVTC